MLSAPDIPAWAMKGLHCIRNRSLIFLLVILPALYLFCMSVTRVLHYVCLCAHVYVLMWHDYHVCYIIADLTMRPPRGGSTPSTPLRVHGIPTFLSRVSKRGLWPYGAWYIREAAHPVVEGQDTCDCSKSIL